MSDFRYNSETGEVAVPDGRGGYVLAETKRNKATGEIAYRGPDGQFRSTGKVFEGGSRKTSRAVSAGIGAVEGFTMGQTAELAAGAVRDPAATMAFGVPGAVLSTGLRDMEQRFGVKLPRVSGLVSKRSDATVLADSVETGVNAAQQKAATDNPVSYGAGELAGFAAPGGAAWKGGAAIARPLTNAVSRLAARAAPSAARTDKAVRYGARLAPQAVGGAGQVALYRGTIEAERDEARTGERATTGDRIGLAAQAMSNPVNYALGAAPSLLYRGGNYLRSGRQTFTPDRIQVETGIRTAPESDLILNTTLQKLGVPASSKAALRRALKVSGYSGDDIDAGIVRIQNRINLAGETGERTGLFVLELEKEFPHAAQNIKDVVQQLATAPPRQGRTMEILYGALDDQYSSQRTHFDRIVQEKLGTTGVSDELAALAQERAAIGKTRDRAIEFAISDRRGIPIRRRMRQLIEEFDGDREVSRVLRAAARKLGYSGREEVKAVLAAGGDEREVARLVQKFGEEAGKQIRTGNDDVVLRQVRDEFEGIFDELSRYNRESGNVAFAKRRDGSVGPYKEQQAKFRQNYSQEEAIEEASKRFTSMVRDPVKADDYVRWFNGLPEAEQRLARVVMRQRMEQMLRGGNIDDLGVYLTNLRKEGVHDVLVRTLGEKDGMAISRAIRELADEQAALKNIDPRQGLQRRVVRGAAADRARNLYTTNALARLGDRMPTIAQGGDIAFMMSGQLPYITLAKQGSKLFRPRARTREGLARLLSARSLEPGGGSGPRVAPVSQTGPQPAVAASAASAPPQPSPNALAAPPSRPQLPGPQPQGPSVPPPAPARTPSMGIDLPPMKGQTPLPDAPPATSRPPQPSSAQVPAIRDPELDDSVRAAHEAYLAEKRRMDLLIESRKQAKEAAAKASHHRQGARIAKDIAEKEAKGLYGELRKAGIMPGDAWKRTGYIEDGDVLVRAEYSLAERTRAVKRMRDRGDWPKGQPQDAVEADALNVHRQKKDALSKGRAELEAAYAKNREIFARKVGNVPMRTRIETHARILEKTGDPSKAWNETGLIQFENGRYVESPVSPQNIDHLSPTAQQLRAVGNKLERQDVRQYSTTDRKRFGAGRGPESRKEYMARVREQNEFRPKALIDAEAEIFMRRRIEALLLNPKFLATVGAGMAAPAVGLAGYVAYKDMTEEQKREAERKAAEIAAAELEAERERNRFGAPSLKPDLDKLRREGRLPEREPAE